ncbi:MAG: cobamide remodeling phosphodiesterase CbiR [Deferribacterales bacterium]
MKISAPSFVIPADREKNVLYLKELVDEVELAFFDSRHDFDMPPDEEIQALSRIDMTYSAHLPTDADLNTENGWRVIDSYIRVLRPLKPVRLVIHPVESSFFLNELIRRKEHNIIIENTDFYGPFFDDAVEAGIRLCFDNAHAGDMAENFLGKYSRHIDEYHLQGIIGNRHHKSLEHIEKSLLKSIFRAAEKYNSTVCLEIFNEADFLKSYDIFKELS